MNSTDNPQTITFGPLVSSEILGFETPSTIEIASRVFYFNEEEGCYYDADGVDLYIEPADHSGVLTQDSYWEF